MVEAGLPGQSEEEFFADRSEDQRLAGLNLHAVEEKFAPRSASTVRRCRICRPKRLRRAAADPLRGRVRSTRASIRSNRARWAEFPASRPRGAPAPPATRRSNCESDAAAAARRLRRSRRRWAESRRGAAGRPRRMLASDHRQQTRSRRIRAADPARRTISPALRFGPARSEIFARVYGAGNRDAIFAALHVLDHHDGVGAAGRGAPVMISTASPALTSPVENFARAHFADHRSSPGKSAARTANPSRAERANGG